MEDSMMLMDRMTVMGLGLETNETNQSQERMTFKQIKVLTVGFLAVSTEVDVVLGFCCLLKRDRRF